MDNSFLQTPWILLYLPLSGVFLHALCPLLYALFARNPQLGHLTAMRYAPCSTPFFLATRNS
jgi:hypothetical protein